MNEKITDEFAAWLCGLIDGEGSFSLLVSNNSNLTMYARMSLALRADDWATLHMAWDTTTLGSLRPSPSYSASSPNPSIHWYVFKGQECAILADILKRGGGLRSKKGREFELWDEAVSIIVRHGGGKLSSERLRLEEIRQSITSLKAWDKERASGFDTFRGIHPDKPVLIHPKHRIKTTDESLAEIRSLFATGEYTQVTLAKRFGLSTAYMNKILRQPHD